MLRGKDRIHLLLSQILEMDLLDLSGNQSKKRKTDSQYAEKTTNEKSLSFQNLHDQSQTKYSGEP